MSQLFRWASYLLFAHLRQSDEKVLTSYQILTGLWVNKIRHGMKDGISLQQQNVCKSWTNATRKQENGHTAPCFLIQAHLFYSSYCISLLIKA